MSDIRRGQAGGGHSEPKLEPGDDAAPGAPGTGENLCPDCRGTGVIENKPCPTCGGTGVVIEGVGGG